MQSKAGAVRDVPADTGEACEVLSMSSAGSKYIKNGISWDIWLLGSKYPNNRICYGNMWVVGAKYPTNVDLDIKYRDLNNFGTLHP